MRHAVPMFLIALGWLGSAAPASAGLIVHLPFDGDLIDATGNGNDGVFLGGDAPTFTDGFDGTASGAVLFDGVDDLVALTQAAGLPVTNDPEFTIAMWVKGPVQSDRRVFSEGSSTSGTPLFNLGTHNTGANGTFNSFLRPGPGHRQTTGQVFDDTWHHVAWIDRGGRMDVYIDGVRDPRNLDYTRESRAVDRTSVGGILRSGPCCYFTGAIDDVSIFDHALTESEVQALIPTPGCPADGDTHCGGLEIVADDGLGTMTLDATGSDDSGDTDLHYTFIVEAENGTVQQIGPQSESSVDLVLAAGTWKVTCRVDDDLACFDRATDDTCEREIVVDLPPQVIGHWTFDGTLNDASGNGNHGAFVGAAEVTYVEGFDGNPTGAVLFDGVDDYVVVDHNAGLPIYQNAAYSVAMWVRGPAQPDRRVFSEGMTTDNNPLVNVGTDNTGTTGALNIFIRSGATLVNHIKTGRAAFDDTWHHIVWVDNAGQGLMYIDGVLEAVRPVYTRPAAVAMDTTTIGGILRATSCCWYGGAIDDVRVFNYALTGEAVASFIPQDGCPESGDTHCLGVTVTGPESKTEGVYSIAVNAADDDGGDPLQFTFYITDPVGKVTQVGPQTAGVLERSLSPGTWAIRVSVDDSLPCQDVSDDSECTSSVVVLTEPEMRIASWAFDGSLEDGTGANDGIFVGSDEPVFGVGYDCTAPGAVSFDGVDDYVVVSTVDTLPITVRDNFTIAMWVRGLPQADKRVFSESNTQGNNATLFNLGTDNTGSTGAFDFFYRQDDNTSPGHLHSDGIVFDGTWRHIAWVDRSGDVEFYIDGVLDTANFDYARGSLTVDTTTIGGILRATPCCMFTGDIDDVQIFNYGLSVDEVVELVGSGAAEKCCPIEGMPEFADTTCEGIEIVSPEGGGPGEYVIRALASDGTGDEIVYTLTIEKDGSDPMVFGPQTGSAVAVTLDVGAWSIRVSVDDDAECDDSSASSMCEESLVVVQPGGLRVPGDCNQDGETDMSDSICLLSHLFLGTPATLPCGDGTKSDPSNITLLDWQGDGSIDLPDAVAGLNWLFVGGPEFVLGFECLRIVGCDDSCSP
jgi:hypothetical protein